ncbi:unnamed protein product [Closterium sp. NIES-53]
MEFARTSMVHAAAPHFLWSFAVRYAAHQLNLWPRVSLPGTSPTLRWTGKVGDASVFWVWGSRAFVRDTSADKLPSRAIPRVFLGFPLDAPGWQFYHPTSSTVLPSQDVTFDESVSFYRPAPSGVSQVDPLPRTVPVEVAVDSGAARGVASGGAASGGTASGGVEHASAEPGGAEPEGAEPWGAESEGAESGGAEPKGTASTGGPAGASPRLSPRREPLLPQQLREWFAQHTHLRSGAVGAEGSVVGGTGAGGAGATSLGGAGAAGPGGACTRGTGAAGAGGVGGTRARDPGAGGAGPGGAGAGDPGAGGTSAGGAGAGGPGAGGTRAGEPGAGGAGAGGAGTGGTSGGGTVQRRPFFVPPQPLSQPPLDSPDSALPAPSPYAEQTNSPSELCEPASRHASPVRAVCIGRCVPRPRPPPVPGTHVMAFRPSSVPLRVPLPSPPASTLRGVLDPEFDLARAASPTVPRLLATVVTDPSFESTAASALVAELVEFAVAYRLDYATSLFAESESDCPPSVGGECNLDTDILEDRQEDFECLAAAVHHLVTMLLAPEGDPDAPDISAPRSYAERVKRPPGSPPVFKACYVARGFSQRQGVDFFHTFSPTPKMTTLRVLLHVAAQRDYELHSLDFSTAFAQGSLHEEIWLRRLPGFTGSFPAGTQWSLRRLVYGLRPAHREWHDTLRTTLAALGFTPSTADPSLFLCTDTYLPPFYIFVSFSASASGTPRHSPLLAIVHSLLVAPSDESVEPSGPYPELVGCLMYLMTCTRPDLAYPLSLLARYVVPGRHRQEHWEAAKSVLRYLCSTSGMGLVLGGRGPVVIAGHADASWVDDLATHRSSQGYTFSLGSGSVSWRSTRSSSVPSSSCEADIDAGAMAAQELRWLTYSLTDLGERPRLL